MRCCICNEEFHGYENNPEGAAWRTAAGDVEFLEFSDDDVCCDDCNQKYVIPGRLYRAKHSKEGENKRS